MKNLILLTVISCVFSTYSSAQDNNQFPVHVPDNNKPHLFDSYAQKINFSTDEISQFFNSPVGAQVETKFGGTFRFAGQVVSRTVKYDGAVISVLVRSANFSGACLVISKITGSDGTVSYSGNIVSKNYGDTYVLKQENGQYSMTKKNVNETIID